MMTGEAERAAEGLLAPGEKLLWAGWGSLASPWRRWAWTMPLFFTPLLVLAPLAQWRQHQEQVAFWQRVPGPHPIPPEPHLWAPVYLFGGFILFVAGILWVIGRFVSRLRCLYAITDRRLLVGYCMPGQDAVASSKEFGPDAITGVEVRHNKDGSGDLIFARQRGPAAANMIVKGSSSLSVGLPGISYTTTRGESGFYGVPDVETPAALLRQLQSGALAETAPAGEAEPPAAPPAAPVEAPALTLRSLFPDQVARALDTEGELRFDARLPGFGPILFVLLGMPFVVAGLANGWKGLAILPVGLAFSGLGGYALLWRDRLSCDLERRTYRAERGLYPFMQAQDGTWADWDRITVIPTSAWRRQRGMGMPWKDGKGGGYYVYLLWKGGQRGFPFCGTSMNQVARQVGQALAARLELPLVEEAPPVPSVPRQGFRLSWQMGALLLLGLTWLNSLANGIAWEARWRDGDGNRYHRLTTGWHAETHVLSPEGEVASTAEDYTPWSSHQQRAGRRFGSAAERLDYHGTLRWGRAAAAEEQQRYATPEQAWQPKRNAIRARHQELLETVMKPVTEARRSDPQNAHGAITHALVTAAQALEREHNNNAEWVYNEATRKQGSPAPRDLAAAYLGAGRCEARRFVRSLARDNFERALAVPGCPPDLAEQARRHLASLPR
jgi:hypothetical protein